MPRFYHGGQDQPLPDELRALPLNLQRSQLYPRFTEPTVQAAQTQYGRPAPTILPQRMLFTHWKGASHPNPGQNAVSAMNALHEGGRQKRSAVVAANVPEMVGTPVSYARHAGAMALQLDPVSPSTYEDHDPYPRNMQPPGAMSLTTEDLDNVIRNQMDSRVGSRASASVSYMHAITQAELAGSGISRVVSPAVLPPWWKKQRR